MLSSLRSLERHATRPIPRQDRTDRKSRAGAEGAAEGVAARRTATVVVAVAARRRQSRERSGSSRPDRRSSFRWGARVWLGTKRAPSGTRCDRGSNLHSTFTLAAAIVAPTHLPLPRPPNQAQVVGYNLGIRTYRIKYDNVFGTYGDIAEDVPTR